MKNTSSIGRRGVTLLEIMFSIGVVMVGLLGVLALLPLAAHQAQKGLIANRAALAGRNALHEFEARGMRDPKTWMFYFPGGGTPPAAPAQKGMYRMRPPGETPLGWFRDPMTGEWTFSPATPQAVCIDPRFIAANGGFAQSSPYISSSFPYYELQPGMPPANQPRMSRITLWSGVALPGTSTPRAMTTARANQVFVVDDDLMFDLPTDGTDEPNQIFGSAGADGRWGEAGLDDDNNGVVDDSSEAGWAGTDDVMTQRQYEGAFSWLATLAPESNDLYTLSVVVFYQRDATLDMNENSERLVQVATFLNSGIGGGDVVLETRPGRPQTDLELNPNDWLMLAANSFDGQKFRWYRVVAADTEVTETNNGTWQRYATLSGPDWNRIEWLPPAAIFPTQATIMNDIVAVYERVIRLESSVLWGS